MTNSVKVVKVDKKNKTITMDTCDVESVPIVELPIWAGTLHSLDELSGLTGELTKEELDRRWIMNDKIVEENKKLKEKVQRTKLFLKERLSYANDDKDELFVNKYCLMALLSELEEND